MTKRILGALVGMDLNTKGPDVNAVQGFGRSSRIGSGEVWQNSLFAFSIPLKSLPGH